MVFTRSGNSKRGHHGSSAGNNMKNVPRFKSIKDYIILRNVVENEEFKVWKENWPVMFDFIVAMKPLNFKPFEGDTALERYEQETYNNVTMAASDKDENILFLNLNDSDHIYKVTLDYEKIQNGDLGFWKSEKIGYFSRDSKLIQMELISDDRLLVLTSKQLQMYRISKDSSIDTASLVKNLEFEDLDKLDTNDFCCLTLITGDKNEAAASRFEVIKDDEILLDSGELVQIESTGLKVVGNISLLQKDSAEIPSLFTTSKDYVLYSFDGKIVHSKSLQGENDPDIVLDIDQWNEKVAEYEEDKIEDITSLSLCPYNNNLLLTGHINGDIHLWNIPEMSIKQKHSKLLKLRHGLVQNRELLVDRKLKKEMIHENQSFKNRFQKYEYNIVDNYLALKRLNDLDENGVEWIYPYLNKLKWISEYEFQSHCSRSGFIYHWNIIPFIDYEMKSAQQSSDEIESISFEELEHECIQFKHTSGGQRRDRSPKYLEEFNIRKRMINSTGYFPKKELFLSVNNDGMVVIYKPVK